MARATAKPRWAAMAGAFLAVLLGSVACSGSTGAEPDDAAPDDATSTTADSATADTSSSSPTSAPTTVPGTESVTEPTNDDAADEPGEVLHRIEIDGGAERVALTDELIVVTGAELTAFDRTTVEPVWQLDLASPVRGVGATGDPAAPVLATTTAGRVVLVDGDGRVVEDFTHPDQPWDVTVSDDIAWVGDGANRTLLRIDLADRATQLVRGVDLPLRAQVIDDVVWVLGHENARVGRVTIEGRRLNGVVILDPEPQVWPLTIDVGAGALWVGPSDDRLWRIDPTTNQADGSASAANADEFSATEHTIPAADGRYLAVVDGRVWFVSTDTGELIELDPETVEVVQRLEVEGRPIGLTGDADRLVVTSLLDDRSLLLVVAS